jgi:hypothetical protein
MFDSVSASIVVLQLQYTVQAEHTTAQQHSNDDVLRLNDDVLGHTVHNFV